MKVQKPNTDQEVEFTVFANGKPCIEYLVLERSTDDNTVECFIPVAEGDQLTLFGTFTGSCLHAAFDVLADGSFVSYKRIEGLATGDVKYFNKKKLDIKSVFDNPQEPGRTSIFAPDKVVEGNLHVKKLREDHNGFGIWKSSLGLGSLAVIVSLNQLTNESYSQKYSSKTVGAWSSGCAENVEDGGLAPDYELVHKITNDSVSKIRQTKHKRHSEQNRFGKQPWAKLIFYYRSAEAIERAGCEVDGGRTRALKLMDDAESFVRGSTESKRALIRKSRKAQEAAAAAQYDTLTVAPMASRESSANIFMTPDPEGAPDDVPQILHSPLETHGPDPHMLPASSISSVSGLRSQIDLFATTSPSHTAEQVEPNTASNTSITDSVMASSPLAAALVKKKLFGQSLSEPRAEAEEQVDRSEDDKHSKYKNFFHSLNEWGAGESTEEVLAEVFRREAAKYPLTSGKAVEYEAPAAMMMIGVGDGESATRSEEHEIGGQDVAHTSTSPHRESSVGSSDTSASSVIVNERDSTSVPAAGARMKTEEALEGARGNHASRESATDDLHATRSGSGEARDFEQIDLAEDAEVQDCDGSIPGKMSQIRTWFPSPKSSPEDVSIDLNGKTITAEDVGWHIDTSGSTLLDLATALDIREEFQHNRDLTRQFVKLVQSVGYRKPNDGHTYYLKPRTGSQQQTSQQSPEQSALRKSGSPAPSQSGDSPGKARPAGQVKQETRAVEASRDATISPTPVACNSTDTTNAAANVAAPQSNTLKRSASTMMACGTQNGSRESTPLAKRQRREEQALRKAAAVKLRDEMLAKKAAAESAREAKAKQREQELALKAQREAAEAQRDRLAEVEIARILAEGEELADEAEKVEMEGDVLSKEVEALVEERMEDEELED